jgi:hypothetical protein
VADEREVTALELALEAGRTVPRATPWRRVLASRVPVSGEGMSGRCKRCGRALPRFADPIAFGPMGRFPVVRFDRSTMESALLCLFCGPRSKARRSLSRTDIFGAAAEFSSMVASKRWGRWHRVLRRALETEDESERVECIGQMLELFRRFGPGKAGRRRGGGTDPLETLIVSSAQYWSTG